MSATFEPFYAESKAFVPSSNVHGVQDFSAQMQRADSGMNNLNSNENAQRGAYTPQSHVPNYQRMPMNHNIPAHQPKLNYAGATF